MGKTVAAAWMMIHTGAAYWKPVQSGLEGAQDAQSVQALSGCAVDRIFPSRHSLRQPLSPHEAARRDGVSIFLSDFSLPRSTRPLIVEGAGGLMVPLNEREYVIDLIVKLGLPAVLVARSTLGTINHTLLSLTALRERGIGIAGIIINGPKTPHNRAALEEFGKVPIIAEIDRFSPLTRDALSGVVPEIPLLKTDMAA